MECATRVVDEKVGRRDIPVIAPAEQWPVSGEAIPDCIVMHGKYKYLPYLSILYNIDKD
jgi:hypothetical protein